MEGRKRGTKLKFINHKCEKAKGMNFHVHFLGIAIFDVIGTVLLALIAHKFFVPDIALKWVVVTMFVLGEVTHLLFGVETPITRWLRRDSSSSGQGAAENHP